MNEKRRGGGSKPGSRPNNGGARPKARDDDARGRPPTYWRGTIGREARAALDVMALQDAASAGIEQETAEAQLIARLILAERKRRLTPGPSPALAALEGEIERRDDED